MPPGGGRLGCVRAWDLQIGFEGFGVGLVVVPRVG